MNALDFEALCPHGALVLWRATESGSVPACPARHTSEPRPRRARLLDLIRGY